MIGRILWEGTVERIRDSVPLKFLAAVTLLDYAGYLFLASSERMSWTLAIVLFIFSAACWFWAVTWPPFWNRLTLRWQSRSTRRYLGFVDRAGIVTLFFVQIVYSATLVTFLIAPSPSP